MERNQVFCEYQIRASKELKSEFVEDKKPKEKTSSKDKNDNEMSGSRKFFNYVKRHIRLRRKTKPTEVQEINIVPEDDGETWVRKSPNSATSRSSIESKTCSEKSNQNSNEEDKVEVENFDGDDISISECT
ncbi:hypothetical protein FSP39_001466 [Pinctada imbricata]|uniref:Uncharacterized protein n=1 Tax=Pinctada imbricata TaxID=66713 RepID=A0AA88YMS6_PINIB|nr:hypothetical protein FSP39_001466 [Pinctada imbricata]